MHKAREKAPPPGQIFQGKILHVSWNKEAGRGSYSSLLQKTLGVYPWNSLLKKEVDSSAVSQSLADVK